MAKMNKDITSGSLGLSRKIKFKFLLFILMTIIISDGDNALAEGNFPILFNTEDLTKYSKSNTWWVENFYRWSSQGCDYSPDNNYWGNSVCNWH